MAHLSPWFINRILEVHYKSRATCERHYHSASHVNGMFARARELGWNLSPAEELAVLFHDAVYVAGGKHNEEMSAALMYNAIGSTASDPQHFDCFRFDAKKNKIPLAEILVTAKQIILDTITHIPTTVDSCRVIDLDLYGLGTDEFDANSELIYLEFRSLLLLETMGNEKKARKLYDKGRSEWAEQFLKRDKIFYTEKCMPLEKLARTNLKSLIK